MINFQFLFTIIQFLKIPPLKIPLQSSLYMWLHNFTKEGLEISFQSFIRGGKGRGQSWGHAYQGII